MLLFVNRILRTAIAFADPVGISLGSGFAACKLAEAR
jgi:hypothetical protein